MLARHRIAAAVAASALLTALLSGCATADWTAPRDAPQPIGTLQPGFLPSVTPSPEATIDPAAGSWDDVHPPQGYRVVLLVAGDDKATTTMAESITAWAEDEGAELRTIAADDAHVDSIVEAIDMNPDLIISAGNDLVSALALVSASHLDQDFLLIGAEIAEPTHNVTAADWEGGSNRGDDLVASSEYDATTFTAARVTDAVRAGVAAVLHGATGIVVRVG